MRDEDRLGRIYCDICHCRWRDEYWRGCVYEISATRNGDQVQIYTPRLDEEPPPGCHKSDTHICRSCMNAVVSRWQQVNQEAAQTNQPPSIEL